MPTIGPRCQPQQLAKESVSVTASLADVSTRSCVTWCAKDTKPVIENQGLQERDASRKRLIIFLSLVLVGLSLGSVTYLVMAASQQSDFEVEFESFARETADIAENNAESSFGQFQTLATAITSAAIDSTEMEGFPNVTVHHFDLRAQEIVRLTGAEMIVFVPLVEEADRLGWEEYASSNKWWIEQDYDYRGWDVSELSQFPSEIYSLPKFSSLDESRQGYTNEGGFMEKILEDLEYHSEGLSAPIAQFGPAPTNASLAKLDLFSHQIFKKEIVASLEYNVPVISEPTDLGFLLDHIGKGSAAKPNHELLRSFTVDPVKEDFREDSRTIGFLIGVIPWNTFFSNLLPENINGIVVKVVSDCGSSFTYTINGGEADSAEMGDHHNPKYDGMELQTKFFWKEHAEGLSRHCHFDLHIYPSEEFESHYVTGAPIIFGMIIALSFATTGVVFFIASMIATRRHRRAIATARAKAKRTEALVASVFPKSIRERLMEEGIEQDERTAPELDSVLTSTSTTKRSRPIADFFPNTTVVFADITDFTAWSSTRDPTQVFTLLETIYRDFDKIAIRRGVYKVETVGDCYVAVAGLPAPRKDHYKAAARFASDILARMQILTSALESELGPETGELGIRIGVHSGSVTAGVLRGDRARFQLFGDTVNTAARMETTGEKNRIQLSQETACLLQAAGRSHWCIQREEEVLAKGKGPLQTFWLETRENDLSVSCNDSMNISEMSMSLGSVNLSDASASTEFKELFKQKTDRLIKWHVEGLASLLKKIEGYRRQAGIVADQANEMAETEHTLTSRNAGDTFMDEVVEIIQLPKFKTTNQCKEPETVELEPEVYSQLHDYVSIIAGLYNNNSFHNFEHASHVTMSVTKLLGRIVTLDEPLDDEGVSFEQTYGIASDPLVHFAVVFSALIHDVDHPGVPNSQLILEGAEAVQFYRKESIAEQKSIDLAWDLLMDDSFLNLRRAIFKTKSELRRFRQLVVNTIMATDVLDPKLKQLQNERWERAFVSENAQGSTEDSDQIDRKATVVVEHLIQASDVAHTMQHWQVYKKWNAKLFFELYKAYRDGRSSKDPSEFWYEGELSFFDFYVIPLAEKLDDCGVFGVSSHEYLNYALENRREWERKGKNVVEELRSTAEAYLPQASSRATILSG